MMKLNWTGVDCGTWEAESTLENLPCNRCWKVRVTGEGLFSVDSSDFELLTLTRVYPSQFPTLNLAKLFCETVETLHSAKRIDDRHDAASPEFFEALQNIVANAKIEPDGGMGGLTDMYAVPLDDIECARELIARVTT